MGRFLDIKQIDNEIAYVLRVLNAGRPGALGKPATPHESDKDAVRNLDWTSGTKSKWRELRGAIEPVLKVAKRLPRSGPFKHPKEEAEAWSGADARAYTAYRGGSVRVRSSAPQNLLSNGIPVGRRIEGARLRVETEGAFELAMLNGIVEWTGWRLEYAKSKELILKQDPRHDAAPRGDRATLRRIVFIKKILQLISSPGIRQLHQCPECRWWFAGQRGHGICCRVGKCKSVHDGRKRRKPF
jgi:hypothetical protein